MYRLVDETGEVFKTNWEYDDASTPVVSDDFAELKSMVDYWAKYGVTLRIQKSVWTELSE